MKTCSLLIFIFIISPLTAMAQTGMLSPKLQQATQIELVFLKRHKHFTYKANDQITLDIFKRQAGEFKPANLPKCDTTGVICYIKNSKIIEKIYFSTSTTGSDCNTSELICNGQYSLFIYDAARYIEEIYYKQNKR